MNLIELAETGLVPDSLIRIGIRRLLAKRIATIPAGCLTDFADQLGDSPLP